MSAAQSFLSGAISKTINMPNEATVEDILDAYEQSWHQSLKAMAIYRDGSKLSQPLSAKSDSGSSASVSETEIQQRIDDAVAIAVAEDVARVEEEKNLEIAAAVAEAMGHPEPYRRRLPARRTGFTQESRVAGHKVFLRTGEYEDGRLGEIFIDMHKEGAAFRSMINCFAIAVSKGLQYGVPLDEFVETFTFTRFEPQGMVSGHPNIKMSTSIIDYVFRVLGLEYLDRTDLAQVPPDLDDADGERCGTPGYQEPFQSVATETADPVTAAQADPVVAVTAPVAEPVVKTNGKPNGNGANGHSSYGELEVSYESSVATLTMSGALDAQLSGMMGDAPFCDNCGHITVRNGSCYRCLNCGNSLGCS